jgi:hypothetical protein
LGWRKQQSSSPPPPVQRLACAPCPSLLTESGRCHRQRRGEKQRRLRQKRRPGRTIRHNEGAGTQVRTIRQRRLGVKGGSREGGQQCAFDAMMEVAIYLFVGSRLPARCPPDRDRTKHDHPLMYEVLLHVQQRREGILQYLVYGLEITFQEE